MGRYIKNLELKKSGYFCFYFHEFLSSKFNLLCFFSLCVLLWFRLVWVGKLRSDFCVFVNNAGAAFRLLN
jgi:hypothetical protein